MMCGACALQWDFKDPERPACQPKQFRDPPVDMMIYDEAGVITDDMWDDLKEKLRNGEQDGQRTK